jgi:hypothetical protein
VVKDRARYHPRPMSVPSTEPRAGRVRLRALAVALSSGLLALVAAELVARAAYEAPWYERLVAEQQESRELDYERNQYNLRGPAYAYPKPADARRVLMLGDSFTFGMGVARDEDTFARRCERALNAELDLPGVARVELFNGAIIGSVTITWAQVWDEMKGRLDPDVLVLVFFLRDGTLAGSVPEFFDAIRDEIAARNRASWAYRHLALYRLWKDARDRERIRAHYTRAFRRAYFGDEEETAEWRAAREHLARIVGEARARGCTVGFVVFPVLSGLAEEPYAFQDICDLLADFAREHELAHLDLLDAFRGREGADLWVSPFDQHPNEAAHAIAAEALTPFLAELLREHEAR